MATTFKIGDRVIYSGTYSKQLIGLIGTVVNVECENCTVDWDGDDELSRAYTPRFENLSIYAPSPEEKLSMLLNKKITIEQFERM